MREVDEGLSAGDELLAIELAGGKTRAEAAVAAGISERTVYVKLRNPVFAARVRELRADLVNQAVGKLTVASAEAADTLRALLSSSTPPTVRLGAARAILADLVSLAFHQSVEERLSAVEARVGPRPGPGFKRKA